MTSEGPAVSGQQHSKLQHVDSSVHALPWPVTRFPIRLTDFGNSDLSYKHILALVNKTASSAMSGEEAKQPDVAQNASDEPMEQEAAPAAAGAKRKAEEDPAPEGGEQPAAKAAKTEGGEAGEAVAEAGEAAEAAGGDGDAEAEGYPAPEKCTPVQIGYKTFNSGKEAKAYFHNLISKLRKYQNLNDVSTAGLGTAAVLQPDIAALPLLHHSCCFLCARAPLRIEGGRSHKAVKHLCSLNYSKMLRRISARAWRPYYARPSSAASPSPAPLSTLQLTGPPSCHPSPPPQYEFHMVHELIKQGHPEAARKVGRPGWRAAPSARHCTTLWARLRRLGNLPAVVRALLADHPTLHVCALAPLLCFRAISAHWGTACEEARHLGAVPQRAAGRLPRRHEPTQRRCGPGRPPCGSTQACMRLFKKAFCLAVPPTRWECPWQRLARSPGALVQGCWCRPASGPGRLPWAGSCARGAGQPAV